MGEGGAQFAGRLGTQTHLSLKAGFAEACKLDMELDRTLGGVVVRYMDRDVQGKEIPTTYLVSMAHIRMLKLE